ncbi:hypothetical protein C2G38_2240766 [Gigaspora rosea]|uniref:BTB domain-containing protein n=1 Tax=Gigaspora rosea TaxID=44941 RepID=A0A397W4X2_9GLOM|nr:hypothetical protein C2G38_2240766 [Gigaspora rosea]
MVLKFFEKLSNSYLELNDKEDFNIIIDVANINSDEIHVKMVNLKYVSTQQFEIIIKSLYFRNELANINSDENNVKTVNLKHVSTQQFEIIINYLELLNDEEDFNIIINVANINSDEKMLKRYIYGGVVSLENLDNLFIFNLMLIACELLFEELAECLKAFLIIDR